MLDQVFSCLTAWLAPVLCFTAEEAWLTAWDGPEESVHLRLFPEFPAAWRDDRAGRALGAIRDVRRVVTGALELERARQAHRLQPAGRAARLHDPAPTAPALAGLDLAELAITSAIELRRGRAARGAFTLPDVPGVGVVPAPADGEKCERCWRVLPEVGTRPEHPALCLRCADAVAALADVPA